MNISMQRFDMKNDPLQTEILPMVGMVVTISPSFSL